ncbi:MAG TPA: hypothetical protein PKM44_00745 [Turneriella sp.]|nr:hypothetical protein [Turneriella sp.]HMY11510.1 hypothetical protein [Turneriella sp.]HNA79849.1 hypothetical protein [Turneriella sp.]HNE18985.1 hypothetical protein [Turneriella sp.]HNJ65259.1 hypothetical protein [Turneriella sp.]
MLQGSWVSADHRNMRIGGDFLLQSQLVELPADLRQLQLRFTEKMLKATIAQKALEQSVRATPAALDTYA